MTFWGDTLNADKQDPKRKFRFKIQFGTLGDGVVWYAKTVTKPEMTISGDTTHKFLGHSFKFPGSVTWTDIEMVLVDPVSEAASTKLLEIIEQAGYTFPSSATYAKEGENRAFNTISKGKSTAALGTIVISQLDGDGKIVEQWTLHNPFINKVSFGDLSYEDDGLSEISVGITYDWAKYSADGKSANTIFDRTIT